MRLVLETADLLQIIGKHLDIKIDPDKVIVRHEGKLEVEISGIPMTEAMFEDTPTKAASPAKPSNVVSLPQRPTGPVTTDLEQLAEGQFPGATIAERSDPNASDEPPPPGTDGTEVDSHNGSSPASLIAQSRAIQADLDRKNPNLARRSRGGGGLRGSTTAPTSMDGEIT
jgi:hypothetical protein